MPADPALEAAPINVVMRALADPARRAVFEQVVSSDETTAVELTRGSGVTQGAISQHIKARVKDEVLLTATARNLRRLAKLMRRSPPQTAECVA